MMRFGVIADDLTGANATGALLSKRGLSSVSVLNPESLRGLPCIKQDIVIVSTSSRYLFPHEAYGIVSQTFKSLLELGCKVISKRIDTTLRGNIGAEIDAMLNGGSFRYALLVPSFPSAGRICLGGHVLVNSTPLDETEVIRESVFRFDTSSAVKIIASQTKRKVYHVPYDIVRSEGELIKALDDLAEDSIAVLDAVTDSDIDRIALCSLKWGKPFIPVDPGPFTAALAFRLLGSKADLPKILIVIGSVTELIRKQVEYLSKSYDVKWVKINVRGLISGDWDSELKAKRKALEEYIELYPLVGLITAESEKDVISFDEAERLGLGKDLYSKINDLIGSVVSEILKDRKGIIRGLYVSGGDTISAIGKHLGALGVSIKDEVYPLAGFGTFVGGLADGLAVVTKGGLVGKEDTIKLCIDYLLKALRL